MDKVRASLNLNKPVALGVDVACGTGLSSLALLALADRVVATDVSSEMLSRAPEHRRIRYELASAESLPLADSSADLITVSSAFHWFRRAAFLEEARRVLRPGAQLVIYENFFEGRRHRNPEFVRWLDLYYRAHPAPPRDRAPFTNEDAEAAGFTAFERLTYENTWSFDLPSFVAYLLSQSNAVAATESGRYTAASLRFRLTGQLEPFFADEETFPFAGFIWLLRRT